MRLDHLGQAEAARELEAAIETSLEQEHTRTRDLGGSADTEGAVRAVLSVLTWAKIGPGRRPGLHPGF